MGRASSSRPSGPWSHAKAERRAARDLSPDQAWAAEIRAAVLASSHPAQADAITDLSRYLTFLVGRGGGKTTMYRGRYMVGMSATPRGRYVYVAPTLGMATDLLWDPLKDTCDALRIEADFKEVGKTCTFRRNGARLKLVGADDKKEMDKLRGQPFDGVGLDEVALFQADLLEWFIDRIIVPRLGERRGWLGLASTPGHILRGVFYDATRPGAVDEDGAPIHRPYRDRERPEYANWKSWSSHAWSLKDIAELPDAATRYAAIVANWTAALEEKARKKWSDNNPIWMREYLGLWSADDTEMVFRYRAFTEDGKPWNQWDPFEGKNLEGVPALRVAMTKLRELFPTITDWRHVLTQDMGSTDPFASNVLTFSPSDPARNIWHTMPYERTKMYARPIAQLVLGPDENSKNGCCPPDKPQGVIGETGWPDASVMDAEQSTLDELQNVYGVRFKKAERNPNYKVGAVELVNGDLVDGRIKVIKGSPLEKQLQELQWAEDANGRLKENKAQANHSTDTLVYGRKEIAELFDHGTVVADATKPAKPAPDLPPEERRDEAAGEFGFLLEGGDDYSDPWGTL